MLQDTIWKLPVPSTALLGSGPAFEKRHGRVVAMRFSYETNDGEAAAALVFESVEAFRCTYLSACEPAMLEAYDQLVDRGQTDWLISVRAAVSRRGERADEIRHLMIFFDDGPCYEVLCRLFRVERA
jgi:hypothetical protein